MRRGSSKRAGSRGEMQKAYFCQLLSNKIFEETRTQKAIDSHSASSETSEPIGK